MVVPMTAGVLDRIRAEPVVHAGRNLTRGLASGQCLLELLRFLLQVRVHQLWTEPGEKQDQAQVAEAVRDRVAERGVGEKRDFLVVGNRQFGDRAQARAERGRLRHAPRQHADRQTFVESKDGRNADHGGEPRHGHDERQGDLRQRLFLQAAEELRPDRVADREQEQVEERPAQQVGQFGLREDADGHAGDQRADDRSEADALDVETANDRPEQDGEKQAQQGDAVEKCPQ